MHTKLITITLAISWFFISSFSVADVIITNITETQWSDIQSNPSNNVVGIVGFRAGGDFGMGSHELFGSDGSGHSYAESPDRWTSRSLHTIEVAYDASGNLTITVTPPSGNSASLSVTPDNWFNSILISLEQDFPPPFIDDLSLIQGNFNGSSFQELWTYDDGDWNGIEIILPSYNSTNQLPFAISAKFVPDFWEVTGVSADQFLAEFTLVQQTCLLPDDEPDPLDPPTATSIDMNGSLLEITWNADTNGVWSVQRSYTLESNNWVDVSTPMTASNGIVTFSIIPEEDSEFFRLIEDTP